MAGFVVKVNDVELVAVSNEGLNILTAQVHGDVIGSELAAIDVFGGLYGEGEADKHLIWLSDQEVTSNDEIEVTFVDSVKSTYPGRTIAELHPDEGDVAYQDQSMEDVFRYVSEQSKVRDTFSFELSTTNGEVMCFRTSPGEYSFSLGVMWKWLKPDEASVSLTSNSIDGIKEGRGGTKHARIPLRFGESVKFRVSAILSAPSKPEKADGSIFIEKPKR